MRQPLALALIAIAAAGCQVPRTEAPAEPPSPTASPSPTERPATPAEPEEPAAGPEGAIRAGADEPPALPATAPTAGILEAPPEGPGEVAALTGVRIAAHDDFDRIVFDFEGTQPGYHLEYVDRPVRRCGSGEPVDLPGDGWLEIRLDPARAHTEAGAPTVAERDRQLGLPNALRATLTCDFEAVVTWVVSVRSPNPYRASRLAGPPRLVLDVLH